MGETILAFMSLILTGRYRPCPKETVQKQRWTRPSGLMWRMWVLGRSNLMGETQLLPSVEGTGRAFRVQ